ncbi:PucR family transcriptional regulator [Flexivirga caeni]|uniref:PucR family transcriptional regulator n=1 Tax=Flexivirga caeni TaxID=2294115 RepID=A0A3M9MHQ9_9MICO|nr:helix-turn-helix domain-containing protein [Flexivirga caeni]RNI24383.1 PucR family transcriptional regulator [Flexivirga caeni]
MTDARPALTQLAAWAEHRLSELRDRAYDAILDRMTMYRSDDVVPSTDLRASVERNLRFMLTALADPQTPLDLTTPSETGSRRAQQGAPLPEVIRAYRIGFATLWEALVEHARSEGSAAMQSQLLDAVNELWLITDEHALALTESYRSTTAKMLVAQQRRRSALVEALLSGKPEQHVAPWEAARLLGFAPDAELAVVAAETRGVVQESLIGIEESLAAIGVASAWRLSPALQLGVVSLRPAQRANMLSVLADHVSTRTGVSPLFGSLSDTPRGLHLARVALAEITPGEVEVRMFDASPLAALMACEPSEGRRLVGEVLGPVFGLPVEDRAILLETLLAYLNHGGSAERAAKILYCHPNTVRYRLRRLHDLTGRSLSDPNAVAELATAAYAWRFEETRHWAGPS